MLQGFYTAASGMLMQQRNLNLVANNLANVETPGYKSSRLLSNTFQQTLLTRFEDYNDGRVGVGDPVRIVREVADLFTAGPIIETSRPFDFAITGEGYFNVQAENGETYITRDGMFDLDENGFLIKRDGGFVLGSNGQRLQVNTSDIEVSDMGVITNSITGANLGTLAITVPAENATILESRNSMYRVEGGAGAQSADPELVQGAYEDSNVNMGDELTTMTMVQRNFSSASQALKIIDQTYAKAVNIASL